MNPVNENGKLSSKQSKFEKQFVSGFLKRSYSSNVLFWIIYIFMMLLSSTRVIKDGEIGMHLLRHGLETVFLIIALIINNKFLAPRFLKNSNGLIYTLLIVLTVVLLATIQYFVTHLLVENGVDLLTSFEMRMQRGAFMFNAVPMLFFVMLNLFLRIFKEWASMQEIEKKLEEAQKEALKIQLENLKAQVNPHFLFNTLNNIYSLSLFNDERTPETILKLSDLLSYMIYECRGNTVKIDDEIKFIKNYTALEKLRFNENASLELSVDENWNNLKMAPLLFAPFIENAFKHGMNIQSREPRISISIENTGNNRLYFICENYTDNIKTSGPGGIGLKNVRSRLDLLYPERHTLTISNDSGVFKVYLDIDVSHGPELDTEDQKGKS